MPSTGRPPRPLLERLEHFLPSELVDDACWEWQGAPDRHGYGRIRANNRGPSLLAHRVAWEAHNAEPVPAELCVCHRCDNRLCVNPSHLFIGTNLENIQDRDAKKRQTRGTRHHKSKLTPEQVAQIRRLFAEGQQTKSQLAKRFGITDTSVHLIIIRRNWRHLP